MLEILFSEGAAGSMKLAKSIKNIAGSSTSVFIRKEDGSAPSQEELARTRAQVEEEYRKKRENAVPMEGTPEDVAWFPLNLSMGDISDPFSEKRAEFLQSLVMLESADLAHVGRELVESARRSRDRVLAAVEEGKPVRVWTSRNPDEFCGFCHLMTLLPKGADIRVVELPEYETSDREVRTYSSWAELDPMELGRFQSRERVLTDTERRYFARLWRELRRENGPLRAVVSGTLCTVGEDFYDGFILRGLHQEPLEPESFHEGRLIGRILGKYPLGLSDSLVALRLEEFISRGILVPATAPAEGCPIYHRYLRRVKTEEPVAPDDWRLLSVDDSLKKKEINPTDGEELGFHAPYLDHCAFCWTQVEHTRYQHWFIPTDLSCCICEKCFYDFREIFQWRELDGWDIEWD